jgi:hypothetical protein
MHAHRLAEERSLALHCAVADAIERDPSIVARASERLREWSTSGLMHARYAERWKQLLEGPRAELLRVLRDDGEDARALRQSTPFAGCIDPRTRWRIWREVRERLERSA